MASKYGSYRSPWTDTERLAKMTRSRGGFDDSVVLPRRKPVSIDEVDNMYHGSRKACRISEFANDDTEDISRLSYNKDKKLLDDITNKLCRLEFDNVKVGRDVARKTGFRRHIWGAKRPPLEKETIEARRLERLRNPWDYSANNYFRPPHKEPKTKAEKKEAERKKKNRPLWLQSEIIEPRKPADPYPEQDPLGLYRPRAKKERKELPPAGPSKYDDMNLRERLANMRAKVESLPKRRHVRSDLEALMDDVVNKPLPRSDIKEYKTLGDDIYDPEWDPTPLPGLDDRMKRKFTDSRAELAQFEHMLDRRFGRKGVRGPSAVDKEYNPFGEPVQMRAPSKVPARVDMRAGINQLERELGIHDDAYVEPYPTPVYRMAREPVVVKARTSARAGYRPRTGSLPPPDRVGRAKLQSDIENEVMEYLERPAVRTSYRPSYRASSIDRSVLPSPTPVRRSREAIRAQTPTLFTTRSSSLDRMPSLDPYRPNQGHVEAASGGSSAIAPYQPSRARSSGGGARPSGLPPKAPAFRPHMSDTRRRIREVMCSTKRDPHYYD